MFHDRASHVEGVVLPGPAKPGFHTPRVHSTSARSFDSRSFHFVQLALAQDDSTKALAKQTSTLPVPALPFVHFHRLYSSTSTTSPRSALTWVMIFSCRA